MQLIPQFPNPILIDCLVDTIFLFSGIFNSILLADSVEHRRIPDLVMSDTGGWRIFPLPSGFGPASRIIQGEIDQIFFNNVK